MLNLPLAPAWAKLLRIPRPYLYAGILFFASHGCVCRQRQPFDLFLLLGWACSASPCAGSGCPSCRSSSASSWLRSSSCKGRRALQLSGGEWHGLLGGWVSGLIYTTVLVVLFWPLVRRFVLRRRARMVTG